MEKLNLDKKSLRKFGITMGVFFLLIAALILFRTKRIPLPITVISAGFFVFGIIVPNLLKPVYIFWMKLARVMGWVNTRIILIIIFYLIFTPIGILMKLFGANLLDKKIEKNRISYWKNKEKKPFKPLDFERQF